MLPHRIWTCSVENINIVIAKEPKAIAAISEFEHLRLLRYARNDPNRHLFNRAT